jgi:hypothetical protein
MTPRPWTLDALERACRKVLVERSSLRLKALPLSRSADCEWVEPGGHARMRVDPHQTGLLTGVVHELLHVALSETLAAFDEDLSEEIICALEVRLTTRISLSKRRVAWWRKAITGKLPRQRPRKAVT